jgi:hypothetical protein
MATLQKLGLSLGIAVVLVAIAGRTRLQPADAQGILMDGRQPSHGIVFHGIVLQSPQP